MYITYFLRKEHLYTYHGSVYTQCLGLKMKWRSQVVMHSILEPLFLKGWLEREKVGALKELLSCSGKYPRQR